MAEIDWGTSLSNFSETVQSDIKKDLIQTLRAGLVCLPKGSVIPAVVTAGNGKTFSLTYTAYADFADGAVSSLTEGTAPTPLKMGLDTQTITVAQKGAWVKTTDIAEFQSPHRLSTLMRQKIARLAATGIDAVALAALDAHGVDNDSNGWLSTGLVVDAVTIMRARNVEPVNGMYYILCHPYALAGLLQEEGLSGYVDVAARTDVSAYSVAQYRGVNFITSSRLVADADGNFPCYTLGKDSMAFGDIGTVTFHFFGGTPDSANPLQQLAGAGWKGIVGGAVVSLPESTDGAGSNGAAVPRAYVFSVVDGRSNQ
jgi:N4-gp56 family major capsid protein